MISRDSVKYFQVAQGVWGMKLVFVNIYMVANRKGFPKRWVLIDAGPKGCADKIIAMAESIFGKGAHPSAIVLTHGHSDHTGSLPELLKHWNVPVYAHPLEIPFLTGRSAYPPADPAVGGGLMTLLSPLFRREPLNLGRRIKAIDVDRGIPELPEWKVIHTPGHSPGHVSLFLPFNTTLIAGDAFLTTKPESAIYALKNIKKLSGPPKYMTIDWTDAKKSVKKLAALQPRIAATGHGPVMRGRELQTALTKLAENFERQAVPSEGRYVRRPALATQNGIVYVPPFKASKKMILASVLIGTAAGLLVARQIQKAVS
ncbi:MBL fold metallo-hydrolase [Mucilaginibacter sp. RS28]|uniref:MBL fold metallo-hydrolase n=1 Tax=Mucilaginibacter straminoryzae TaxID=2932774 RepID=A0A9X1X566_9SPHI|nr:MBL fold metallo-hydrolase [Mucilaginibacter straminoryzae]MCJ8211148.1 MBL fold metallo-hydrolase [Mucilaginibacter straminoryzae]